MGANGEEASATIYVENLPNEANESMLNLLFQQFPGFKKSRPLPSGGKERGFLSCFDLLIIFLAKQMWLIHCIENQIIFRVLNFIKLHKKAFIDFAEPGQASSAKTALNGFKVTPEKAIQLSFAKN